MWDRSKDIHTPQPERSVTRGKEAFLPPNGIDLSAALLPSVGEHDQSPVSTEPGAVAAERSATARVTPGLVLKTGLGSSACWSGLGATVVCIGSSYAGLLGHGLSTLWTLRNEVMLTLGRQPRANPDDATPSHRGYLGLIRDICNTPGFNSIAAGITYLGAGVEAAVRGRLLEGSVFVFYFAGSMAIAATLNRMYTGSRIDQTLPERAFKALWGSLPKRMQVLIKDPGLYLSVGNTGLVLGTLDMAGVFAHPLQTATLAVGVGLASLGLVPAARNLISGTESGKVSAQSVYLNGAANALFGLSSFLQGSPIVGAVKVCWTISCCLLARMMQKKQPDL